MKRVLVIVGNAPLARPLGAEIDAADFVMRFNEPPQDAAHHGTKTDVLLLATSSKAMQRWLNRADYLSAPYVQNTPEILCTLHPAVIKKYHPQPNILSRLRGRRADWTPDVIQTFGQIGKRVSILPVQDYLAVCETLGIAEQDRSRLFPSTGFLGIWHALRSFPRENWDIQICGFTWQGWKRHAWDIEKSWLSRKIDEGHLRLLD